MTLSKKEYEMETGEWGALPEEPCRYCHRPGGVCFALNEGPAERNQSQAMRCTLCGLTWYADSARA